MVKTNVMRLLEAAGVAFEAREYEWSEDDLSATHAAEMLGLPPEMVFKTLVAKGDKTGHVVFCIPTAEELDLKKAASASGNKRVELIALKELLPTTGYLRGGCSPIGMRKKFPTYIDETYELFDRISVSAGQRGVQVIVSPDELVRCVGAKGAELT